MVLVKDPVLKGNLERATVLEDMVLSEMGGPINSSLRNRIDTTLNNWEGREADVFCVLHYAAEKGKVEEYLDKLDKIYEEHLQMIPKKPGYRRNSDIPAAQRTEDRVMLLYKELGVKKQT